MEILDKEQIESFVEAQLAVWPLARRNFDLLAKVERKPLRVGDFEMAVQYNPERIRSTAADTSAAGIASRRCFLCRCNRPPEQMKLNVLDGWDICLNPYPILPVHLTVLSHRHVPQDSVPGDIVKAAEAMPGMAVFFNGAQAGASLPDHLHMQAVIKDELPLLRLAERHHASDSPGLRSSMEFGLDLPFVFFSGVVEPGPAGLPVLMAGLNLGGPDASGRFRDKERLNTFFWTDAAGLLRFVVVPRRCHRPQAYFKEGDEQRLISPGCLDMAGILVAPRRSDFDKLDVSEIRTVFAQTAVAPADLPNP